VDAGMIFGTGFPPFHGGLLRYADEIGMEKIRKDLEGFAGRFGDRFKPADLIVKMAGKKERFYPEN